MKSIPFNFLSVLFRAASVAGIGLTVNSVINDRDIVSFTVTAFIAAICWYYADMYTWRGLTKLNLEDKSEHPTKCDQAAA